MIAFLKCSFIASKGFHISLYDEFDKSLKFISEQDDNQNNLLPTTIKYTLSNQLGRCLFLASDENGKLFFAVFGLIEGNCEKYVNAVFYEPENPQRILALYYYFCNNQYSGTRELLKCVSRIDVHNDNGLELEYTVDGDMLNSIIQNSDMYYNSKECKSYSPNSVFAFITNYEYVDYQIAIEEKFKVKNMFTCENYNMEFETVDGYQSVDVYKNDFTKLFIVGLVIIVLIVLIFIIAM